MRSIILFILVLCNGTAASQETLTLTESGIKELKPELEFNLKKITNALPGYRVRKSSNGKQIYIRSEAKDEPIITLHRLEKNAFNIEIHNNNAKNTLGHNIGDTFLSIFGASMPDCVQNQEFAKLACLAPGSKKILYVFPLDDADRESQKLVSILWSYQWWIFR